MEKTIKMLKEVHNAQDMQFQLLEGKIVSQTEKITTADSRNDAIEEALTLEYLIVELRAKINQAISHARSMQAMQLSEPIKATLKSRELSLTQRSQRLTDLREDLNSLQKLAYVSRNMTL